MGVDRSDYIIYGWKLPYKVFTPDGVEIDLWDDPKFLPYIEGHKGIDHTLIIDGMSGEYTAFGDWIASGNDSIGFEFIELEFSQLNPESTKNKFKEVFGFDPPGEPKILVFTHWS